MNNVLQAPPTLEPTPVQASAEPTPVIASAFTQLGSDCRSGIELKTAVITHSWTLTLDQVYG